MSADNHRDASTTRKLGLHSYAPKSESAANGQLRRLVSTRVQHRGNLLTRAY